MMPKKLRFRVAAIFAGMMLLMLLITTALSWYELIAEPQDPNLASEERNEPIGWRLTEVLLEGSITILACSLVAWWLTHRMVRSIEGLTAAVEKVGDGDYGTQLPSKGSGDEIDRLTASFNAMSARVADSFRSVGEFTLNASHELKTPLTVLRATFERRLPSLPVGSPERDELASALDEIQRITRIVDQLSLLSKADSGVIKLKAQSISVQELLTSAMEDAEVLAEGRRIQVTCDLGPVASLEGDRHRLRQLLLILADNAVKYSHPETGVIHFSFRRDEMGQGVISVSNNGHGVPPEHRERVFERFFRGDISHSHQIEGSGLGLSIAQWIVRAHRGTIQFTSTSELTTVTVTLPPLAPISGVAWLKPLPPAIRGNVTSV
jgi:signal transduction histidine kinase